MKCQTGWIANWTQDFREKYQQPQICSWYHSNRREWRGTKKPLDESERGQWKSWLKTQHSKTKIMSCGPITSWQRDVEKAEAVADFFFPRSKHLLISWLQPPSTVILEPKKIKSVIVSIVSPLSHSRSQLQWPVVSIFWHQAQCNSSVPHPQAWHVLLAILETFNIFA